MSKRRPSGDGMVRKRDDGRWEGRIVVGHKADGRPIFRYLYADNQKELTAKLRQSIDVYVGANLTEESTMSLSKWLDRWLDQTAASVRPRTLEGYRRDMENYVKPRLGQMPLARLTAEHLHKLYTFLLKEGRRNQSPGRGPGLAPSTIRGIHSTLHGALAAAVEERLLPANPADRVVLPKGEKPSLSILTSQQIERFLAAIRADDIWHDFFYIELTTGLRRGELCGLRWEDFNEATGELAIRRTVHTNSTVGDTKTYAGTRHITLPASAAKCLRKRGKTALAGWIFPDPLKPEEPINPGNAYRRLKKLLRENDLPNIRFHDLRHTFATHALASGVDAKTLASILGHTKASFTLDTYAHVTEEMQQRAAEITGDFMTDILGGECGQWQNANGAMAASI